MTQKGEIVERLQVKAESIGKILANIEKKYQHEQDDHDARMKKSPSAQLALTREREQREREKQRANLKMFQIPAFNPNKVRKSPLTDESPSTSTQSIPPPQDTQPEPE